MSHPSVVTTFIILIICSMVLPCRAQVVSDTFGSTQPISSSLYGPVYYGNDFRTFSIYSQAELAAGGIVPGMTIYGVAYYKTNAAIFASTANATLDVMVRSGNAETDYSSLPSLSWPYVFSNILSAGFAPVAQYTANTDLPMPAAAGWMPLLFDATFTYTGGSLEFYTNWSANPGVVGFPNWGMSNTGAGKSMYTDYPLTNSVGTSGSRWDQVIYHSATAPSCAGTPVPGSVYGPAAPCAGDSFSLYLFNPSAGPGISYQWQKAPANSTAFTNIAGATSPGLVTIIGSPTVFRCQVLCSNSGMSSYTAGYTVSPVSVVIDSFTVLPNNFVYFFTPYTQNAASYSWDFGDGGSSSQMNPSHYYFQDSVYTVRLIATGDCGADTMYKNISVGCVGNGAYQSAVHAVPDSMICQGESVTIMLNTPPPPGFSVKWQSASASGLFSDMTGQTGNSITVSPASVTKYRSMVICNSSNIPRISVPVMI
ncbi:MAG: PKD domain-containing protein, partial [Sphingobacteriales bacterium]